MGDDDRGHVFRLPARSLGSLAIDAKGRRRTLKSLKPKGKNQKSSISEARTERALSTNLPPCPKCASEYTYEDGPLLICPECSHEFSREASSGEPSQAEGGASSGAREVYDAFGNLLQDGDSVTVVKSLKVRGSSSVVKIGTRVKNIRIVDGDHEIDCRIDGIGAMKLKAEFVRKS